MPSEICSPTASERDVGGKKKHSSRPSHANIRFPGFLPCLLASGVICLEASPERGLCIPVAVSPAAIEPEEGKEKTPTCRPPLSVIEASAQQQKTDSAMLATLS